MKKKKGFTILEAIVIAVILAVAALFSIPVFFTPEKQKQEATVRANVSIAASAAASGFAVKTGANAERIAEAVIIKLNNTTKNPIEKDEDAYFLNSSPVKGAVVLIPDNEEKLIKIKGYGETPDEPLLTKIIRAPDDYQYTKDGM